MIRGISLRMRAQLLMSEFRPCCAVLFWRLILFWILNHPSCLVKIITWCQEWSTRSKFCDGRVKLWNEDRTQNPAIGIGDLEKYMSQETVTGAGNLSQIEEANAPEEKGTTPEVHLTSIK